MIIALLLAIETNVTLMVLFVQLVQQDTPGFTSN